MCLYQFFHKYCVLSIFTSSPAISRSTPFPTPNFVSFYLFTFKSILAILCCAHAHRRDVWPSTSTGLTCLGSHPYWKLTLLSPSTYQLLTAPRLRVDLCLPLGPMMDLVWLTGSCACCHNCCEFVCVLLCVLVVVTPFLTHSLHARISFRFYISA